MSNFETVYEWIKIHTDGTCDEANDCLITLAQAIQSELENLDDAVSDFSKDSTDGTKDPAKATTHQDCYSKKLVMDALKKYEIPNKKWASKEDEAVNIGWRNGYNQAIDDFKNRLEGKDE